MFKKKLTYHQNVSVGDRIESRPVTKTSDEWVVELMVEQNNTLKRIEDNLTLIAKAQMILAGMVPRTSPTPQQQTDQPSPQA